MYVFVYVCMCVRVDATLSGRRDGDGLCCELLVKVARVRLRGHLGLKGWHQLLGSDETHEHLSTRTGPAAADTQYSCGPVARCSDVSSSQRYR